ncbi:MAG TPA: hypothetical protein VGB24_08635 [Longimicrobium sp.]|uniref:hypothetical protein n=1 Tax=Longimicrobium sp. TaxID=2029185 RepID=UPI002ED93798
MGADKARKAKPRVIPPLPVWPRQESAVLDEVPEPAIAVELWLYLRHLRDWVDVRNRGRTELFVSAPTHQVRRRRGEALAQAGALEPAIATFHELSDAPARLPPERLVSACIEVADWAEKRGYAVTASQFAAAATRLAPDSPRAANVAAVVHRRLGEWASAELYYLRAARYARRQKNAVEYVSAHIGMAALANSRGRYKAARRHLERASIEARRSGSTWLAGHAQHDLMLMLTERRDYGQAELAAARAVTMYPASDPRVPFLAADFAFLLLAQGAHADALPLLQRFLGVVETPAEQVIGLSLLARAYAGAGCRDESRSARRAVPDLIQVFPQNAPAALFHMAEACRAEGSWKEAEQLVTSARELAVSGGHIAIVEHADDLAAQIAVRHVPPVLSADEAVNARRSVTKAEMYGRLAERVCAPAAAPAELLGLARIWVDTGRAADAVRPVRRVLDHLEGLPEAERVGAWALVSRVLAADEESRDVAREAWNRAYVLIARAAPAAAVPAAIDLAHAATLLGDERQSATVQAIALGVGPAHDYVRVRTVLAEIGIESTKLTGA